MENNRFCIVHYENKEPYSKLKVNELNESRIREAKEKGEKFSGEIFYEKHCLSVPDAINNKIHIDPCYKRFTLILSKKEDQPITTTRSSKRTSLDDETARSETAWMFPEPCYFCKYTLFAKLGWIIKQNWKLQAFASFTDLEYRGDGNKCN